MSADTLVPTLVVLAFFASHLIRVYLRHQRQMAVIERGLDPQALARVEALPASRLERTLRQIGFGMALTLLLAWSDSGPLLLIGLLPLCSGLARLLAIKLEGTCQTAQQS